MSSIRPETPPPKRLKAPARRARIIEGGLGVFARTGYAATSMADIAAASGVTRAVVYDHFQSKRDLYVAVLGEQSTLLVRYIGTRIPADGPTKHRMRCVAEAMVSFATAHPAAWGLLFVDTTHGDAEATAAWQQARGRWSDVIVDLLTPEVERVGSSSEFAHLELVVQILTGALTEAVRWWIEHPQMSRKAVVEIGTSLMWDGLGHPPVP